MMSFTFQNDSTCQLNKNLEVLQTFQLIVFFGRGVGLEDLFLCFLSTKSTTCHTYTIPVCRLSCIVSSFELQVPLVGIKTLSRGLRCFSWGWCEVSTLQRSHEPFQRPFQLGVVGALWGLPSLKQKKNLKIRHPKRKLVFQPSTFRDELLVSGRVHTCKFQKKMAPSWTNLWNQRHSLQHQMSRSDTPLKIAFEPKDHPIEKENHMNQTSVYRFHVNFPGCVSYLHSLKLTDSPWQ